jgi:site-specific DNA-methyltransferase (adenine-specific)
MKCKNKQFSRVHFSSASVEWPTPQGLFDELNEEFNFTLDPCATHGNAKCKRHFTMEDDGLSQDWGAETVFMNPPYGREIKDWMRKAYESSRNGALSFVWCRRTDTHWFHDYAVRVNRRHQRPAEIRRPESAPFPSAIVIFRPTDDDERIAA